VKIECGAKRVEVRIASVQGRAEVKGRRESRTNSMDDRGHDLIREDRVKG